jgi:hypothetical protein
MGPLAESLHCVGKTKPDTKQNNVEKIEAKDMNVEDINVENSVSKLHKFQANKANPVDICLIELKVIKNDNNK